MAKVEFNAENIGKCLCPGCPVQAQSECVEERKRKETQTPESEAQLPDPETMIRLYCSIGQSSCQDLDGSQECLCPGCPVWLDNELTSRYYCLEGSADEIDMA